MNYIVEAVAGRYPDEAINFLTAKVESLMEEGYEPQGGVSCMAYNTCFYALQSMVRRNTTDEDQAL